MGMQLGLVIRNNLCVYMFISVCVCVSRDLHIEALMYQCVCMCIGMPVYNYPVICVITDGLCMYVINYVR